MSRLIDADAYTEKLNRMCDANCQYSEKQRDVMCGSCMLGLAFDALEYMPTVQQWIPVTERLPEDDEMKLVTCQPKKGDPNVNRAYYMDGFWHGSGSMSNVIAWMDKPEPYKEENNG